MNAVVALAPGAGRLARRRDGLLFVAARSGAVNWGPVIDAYLTAASSDDAREAVTSAAVATRFTLDPFAIVTWAAGVELLVLGDLTLHTDMPSVPALNGATAAAWVEHRVARPPACVRVSAGAAAHADTRLDAGVVACGGFQLSIGAVTAPGSLPAAPLTFAHDASAGDPEVTLRPPLRSLSEPALAVRARRSASGHTNPPHAAQCRVCGDLIGPASPVETTLQPALGRIVLPDGSAAVVDGALVIGRRPDAAAARLDGSATLVALDVGPDVSRTHVVVQAEGWMMTATDCGSRGRTVLRSPGADDPVVLEPWVAHEVAPGDTLYLGGPTHLQVVGA